MGNQGKIWNVSSFKSCFYWLTTATYIPKLRNFPNSVPEHLEEVVTVTEDNFLPKIIINGETKSASKAGVYIVELCNFHFNDIKNQTKYDTVLNAFLGFWTYKVQ